MSLINDALKRAKAAQGNTPPPQPELHLRPAEPSQAVRHGLGYAIPAALALLALLILLFAWRLTRPEALGVPQGSALSSDATNTSAEPPQALGDLPVRARTGGSAAPANTSLTAQSPASQTTNLIKQGSTGAPADPNTNLVSALSSSLTNLNPEPPKVVPLKLQGIVVHPTRPSAVINGRTLFVGDRFQSQRVARIGKDSVTLIGNGTTNVLTLEE